MLKNMKNCDPLVIIAFLFGLYSGAPFSSGPDSSTRRREQDQRFGPI